MTKVWQDKTKRLYAEVVKAAISTLGPEDAEHTKAFLEDLQKELGPVIEAYPKWHPLFRHSGKADRLIEEHVNVVYFANGYVVTSKQKRWLDLIHTTVHHLPIMADAWVSIEDVNLTVKLFGYDTVSVVVRCHWARKPLADGTIPPSLAVTNALITKLFPSLMMEMGQPWEKVANDFLGLPHDRRDSPWFNKDTGGTLKQIWELMLDKNVLVPGRGYPDGKTYYPSTPKQE